MTNSNQPPTQTAHGAFNSPLESALRSLCILYESYPQPFDTQQLVFFDYLVVHSDDVENGPPCLHPPTPFRSSEWVVRRRLVEQGLRLLIERGLVTPQLSSDGIRYSASEATGAFVGCLASPYTLELKDRARWVVESFGDEDEGELVDYFSPKSDASVAYRQAKLDGLKDFLGKIEGSLSSLTTDAGEIQTQLRKLNESVEQTTTAIAVDQGRLREEQGRQRELWADVQESTTRAEVLGRLVGRFNLLERHYASDTLRLGAISEAGGYISQMPKVSCPVCGNQDPWGSDDDLSLVQQACEQEARRIGVLQADLRGTLQDLENEITSLQRSAQRSQRSYDQVTQQIQTELLPANQTSRGELTTLLDTRARLEKAVALTEQIQALKHEIVELEELQSRPKPATRAEDPPAE